MNKSARRPARRSCSSFFPTFEPPVHERPLDEKVRERLEALGYVE